MTDALAKIRLYSSSAGLPRGYLQAWGLPFPDVARYLPYTNRTNLSDGGQALRGIKGFRLMWAELTQQQFKDIYTIATYSTVYATVNEAWEGSDTIGNGWIDVSGQGIIPNPVPRAGAQGMIFENVVLEVRHLTIDSDPASF